MGAAKGSLDVVLVDGRARMACALAAIPYLAPNGVVVIHDYTWRPHYHGLVEYFNIESTVKTLVFLKPKDSARAHPPSAQDIMAKYAAIATTTTTTQAPSAGDPTIDLIVTPALKDG